VSGVDWRDFLRAHRVFSERDPRGGPNGPDPEYGVGPGGEPLLPARDQRTWVSVEWLVGRGCRVYRYRWANNERRAQLLGRFCAVEASGRMGTVLVTFLDNGERVTTSRRALMRVLL
jgi:hypothetical protein